MGSGVSDDLEAGEYRIAGTCGVVECTARATAFVYAGTGPARQAIGIVCAEHERANTEPGWVLRSHAGRQSVLYPPGYPVPPFPE